MFGLTFLQPMVLMWLVGLAIPILIHLWRRQHYEGVEWAAIDLVLTALRSERRRLLLRQYLLLFLRLLTIALVVLAAARPMVQNTLAEISFSQKTVWLFVLDDSLSMEYREDGKSLFERAKEGIERWVANAPQGDAFLLLTAADQPRWSIRYASYDKEGFVQELGRLTCRHTSTDWGRALQLVAGRVQSLREEEPGISRVVVAFFTDGQKTNWLAEPSDAHPQQESATALAVLRSSLQQLAESSEIVCVPLVPHRPANAALTRLEANPENALVGQEIVIAGTAHVFGSDYPRLDRLEWLIDGRRVAEQGLVWAGDGEELDFTWSYQFESPGEHVIEAALPTDSLEPDNRRGLIVRVSAERAALCVDGRPSSVPWQGASGYLRAALWTRASVFGNARMRVDVLPQARLPEANLRQYDVVFLCDVSQTTLGETQALKDFVTAGGGLVIFLGPRVNVERYNDALGHSQNGVGLLPGVLQKPESAAGLRLDPLDFRHPIVRVFQGPAAASLISVPVRQYMPLRLRPGEPASVALRLSNGDPLIVASDVGLGRAIVVTTSADLTWSSWPLWMSYVPCILEMENYAGGRQTEVRTVTAGQSLGLVLAPQQAREEDQVQLRDARGNIRAVPWQWVDGLMTWRFADTELCGIYRATIPDQQTSATETETLFAVNAPLIESDIRPWDFAEFVEHELPMMRCVVGSPLPSHSRIAGGAAPGNSFVPWLLHAALVCLLLEVYLGRGR